MNSKKLLKIFLPILILAAIIAVWFIKNNGTQASGSGIPLEITEMDMEEIMSHGLPVILDFGADSCAPCLKMYPDLVSINEKMQGKAVIHFTDVWKYPETIQDLPIRVIPTQFFYTSAGGPYVPSEEMKSSIDFTLYSSPDGKHLYTYHEGALTEGEMRIILSDMGVE